MAQAMKGFRLKPVGSNKRLLAGLLFLVASSAFAQGSAAERTFSPYVSHLTAENRNNLVRLSWIDSSDARGPVYIFRSTRPFSETVPLEAGPIQVSYGIQSYVDETEGFGTVYYFVVASDVQGWRYDTFILYTNTATVNFSAVPEEEAAQVQLVETQRAGDSVITGLTAHAQGEGVIVSFVVNGVDRNKLLYRSTQPIRRVQDLLDSLMRSGISSPFIDYPAPGSSYYYAIVFEDDILRRGVEIQPGRNATVEAVEIAGKAQGIAPTIRAIPLPSLSVYKASPGSDFYSELPSPALPQAGGNAETAMRGQFAPSPLKRPRAFARDLEAPEGGEESILRSIVQGPFVRREWQNAREQLLRFLAFPRSRALEARAHFYLGQTYYYSGRNRDALLEFLVVQSTYPNEANEWIEVVLTGFTK
jgi:hypothetical protein